MAHFLQIVPTTHSKYVFPMAPKTGDGTIGNTLNAPVISFIFLVVKACFIFEKRKLLQF